MLLADTGPVTERLQVREIDDDKGQRLVRVVRRGSGSVVTWRRAQMVLLSAQGMDVRAIADVEFTSEDRVRDVIRSFNADGFSSLYPKYKGGRPPKFTLAQRREVKKIAKSGPAEHDLRSSRVFHPLKGDALLAHQDAQPLVADVVEHPLSDQELGQLRQAPVENGTR
jgi:Winged helix-turn helix